MEPYAQERKTRRHERDVCNRKEQIHKHLIRYKESVKPAEWPFLPDASELCESGPLKELAETWTGSVDLTDAEEARAAAEIPAAVARIKAQKYACLAALVTQSLPADDQPHTPSAQTGAAPPDALATTIFVCAYKHHYGYETALAFFVGFASAAKHQRSCGGNLKQPIRYNTDNVRALAVKLVSLAGKDPRVTTAAEMDALGARYFCMGCPVRKQRKVIGRDVYSWRGIVRALLCSHAGRFIFQARLTAFSCTALSQSS